MNWKVKALGQSVLSKLPCATTLNYLGQRLITRAHADMAGFVAGRVEKARWFREQYVRHRGRLHEAEFYEFGAGQSLAGPLALYCLGVNQQRLVDLTPCARLELVNRAIAELDSIPASLARRPGGPVGSLEELDRRFGIVYRAPSDARNSGLPPASLDCVTSTYTLEHIPTVDMRGVLAESYRILKPGGVILSYIDYQDHYSYRDSRVSVYNFLKYSERQWRWFNSALHYQNRLRHSQYRQEFAGAGFDLVSEELQEPSPRDLDQLQSVRLSADFRQFSREDLILLGSQMVCRRPEAA